MLRAAGKRVGDADPEQLRLPMELSAALDQAIIVAIVACAPAARPGPKSAP
jgi:hypothetical protein